MKFSELSGAIDNILCEERDQALAYVTHYAHTFGTPAAAYYSDEAQRHLLPGFEEDLGSLTWDIPVPPKKDPKFDFIDLFAGIGGMRIAMQDLGGRCVFSSEWDRPAQHTYLKNFGELPFGDITKVVSSQVPDHDILLAGFPCQAFSIAGRRGGFEDTRGTLFFHVARLINEKQPKAFLLENVKGLTNHDKGRTLATILAVLRDELGYFVPDPQIINAKHFGVPQNRERIIIVGFRADTGVTDFKHPAGKTPTQRFIDIREKEPVSAKYYLSETYLETLRRHRARHEAAGHGFGYEVIADDAISNAIVVGGMGRERNLVFDDRQSDLTPVTNIKGRVNREGIRKMTPREWARLQGFPEKFNIVVSDAQAYKQFGNSVAMPAIKAVGREIVKRLEI